MSGHETVREKARRLLGDGRLTLRVVDHDQAVALVRGDTGALHRTDSTRATGWYRSSPARTRRCAHLTALRLITVAAPPATDHNVGSSNT